MAKAGGSKVSKNAKTNRGENRKYLFNGVEVKPVRYFGLVSSYTAVSEKASGNLVLDSDKNPLAWHTAGVVLSS